jgi:ribosomal protein S27AE
LLEKRVVVAGMKKMCPRCGVIFEASDATQKFCSGKCEKIFAESSLGYVKRGQTERKIYAP